MITQVKLVIMHVSRIYKSHKKADIEVMQMYDNQLVDFTEKTVDHIQRMYRVFGKEKVFGRSDMQLITGLGTSRASELLKKLIEVSYPLEEKKNE